MGKGRGRRAVRSRPVCRVCENVTVTCPSSRQLLLAFLHGAGIRPPPLLQARAPLFVYRRHPQTRRLKRGWNYYVTLKPRPAGEKAIRDVAKVFQLSEESLLDAFRRFAYPLDAFVDPPLVPKAYFVQAVWDEAQSRLVPERLSMAQLRARRKELRVNPRDMLTVGIVLRQTARAMAQARGASDATGLRRAGLAACQGVGLGSGLAVETSAAKLAKEEPGVDVGQYRRWLKSEQRPTLKSVGVLARALAACMDTESAALERQISWYWGWRYVARYLQRGVGEALWGEVVRDYPHRVAESGPGARAKELEEFR
jgi:hypothetical protein